jgi:hypothetical protein
MCDEEKDISEFYSQNKHSKTKGDYIYYNPQCKECTIEKSMEWQKENPEKYRMKDIKRNKKPERKQKMKMAATKQRLEGKHREWQRNNPEKLKEYALRRQNKIHEFTEEEWLECKEYFNYECAYCGLHEADNLIVYNQHLHRDHVIHDGSNDIENCVPACVGCNVSKGDNEFTDWYNEDNPKFRKRKLNKIINWMTKECFKVLNI